MKKIYFLTLILFSIIDVNSQVIDIPDPIFKNTLLLANTNNAIARNSQGSFIKIDVNNDGQIQVSEAQTVAVLDVHDRNINSLTGINSFSNLINLICHLNNLTELDVNGISSLAGLTCYANNLSALNLVDLPNLYSIDCGYNQLQTLSLSNLPSLNYLRCVFNQLTSINFNNVNNLITLQCSNNNFTSLIFNGLNSVETIECSNNQITELSLDIFPSLISLDCSYNQLNTLIVNNPNLSNLNCSNNTLSSLDLTNALNLMFVFCQNNSISSIDFTGLEYLNQIDCSYNLLTDLYFNNNNFTQVILDCSFNNLTTLDLTSLKIDYLNAYSNNLETIFIKDSYNISTLFLSQNPSLRFICADESEISTIQQILSNNGYSSCNVNSYCSFVPGGIYYTISGNSKLDSNINGCTNDDQIFNDLKINITNTSNTAYFIPNETGSYLIPVQNGSHTLTPILENPTYFNISPASFSVTFPGISPYLQDFCITPNGIHNDLEVVIVPLSPARPGFDATYKVVYKNKGNIALSGTVTFGYEEDKMDLVTSTPLYSSETTGLLTYNYVNLQPFETREVLLTMNINSPQETTAVNNGDQLNFTALINPLSGDEYLFDNNSSLKQIVVGSYDPNDKTCIEGTIVGPEMIGQYVHYVIRFENTGTFPAENVVVKDMIDLTKFDLSTLIPTSSSHSFVTRIAADGKVEFIFENIQLPFDDANNDGYIAFKIKTLPSLVVGDTFSNKANIYFDYNFPIETNTASTTIQVLGNSDFNLSDYVTLYPNPVKNELNVSVKEMISITSINIYNSLGQLVLASTNPEGSVDVSSLKSGNYFIKLISDKGVTISQFIKE